MKRITALVLVFLLLASICMFASCAGEKKVYTYKLVVSANGVKLIDLDVEMEDANPTVNEVVLKAIEDKEAIAEMIVLDDEDIDIDTVKDIDKEYSTVHTSELISGWEFFINDETDARQGRADDVRLSPDDTVRYVFYSETGRSAG